MAHEYECPYCAKGMDDVDDMHKTETSYEVECHACEKVFYVRVEYTIDYYPHTAESEVDNIKRAKKYFNMAKQIYEK